MADDPPSTGEQARGDGGEECRFETFGWSCSAGYLGIGEGSPSGLPPSPCPRCNTRAFLLRAWEAARKQRYTLRRCVCCGPGMPASEIWTRALTAAREENPAMAESVLRELA
jgi:hypothetical protein